MAGIGSMSVAISANAAGAEAELNKFAQTSQKTAGTLVSLRDAVVQENNSLLDESNIVKQKAALLVLLMQSEQRVASAINTLNQTVQQQNAAFNKTQSTINNTINSNNRYSLSTRNAAGANNYWARSANRSLGPVQQLGYAAEDAAVSFGTGGWSGALRGAANNLNVVAFSIHPVVGVISTLTIVVLALVPAFLKWRDAMKETVGTMEDLQKVFDETEAMQKFDQSLKNITDSKEAKRNLSDLKDELEIVNQQLEATTKARNQSQAVQTAVDPRLPNNTDLNVWKNTFRDAKEFLGGLVGTGGTDNPNVTTEFDQKQIELLKRRDELERQLGLTRVEATKHAVAEEIKENQKLEDKRKKQFETDSKKKMKDEEAAAKKLATEQQREAEGIAKLKDQLAVENAKNSEQVRIDQQKRDRLAEVSSSSLAPSEKFLLKHQIEQSAKKQSAEVDTKAMDKQKEELANAISFADPLAAAEQEVKDKFAKSTKAIKESGLPLQQRLELLSKANTEQNVGLFQANLQEGQRQKQLNQSLFGDPTQQPQLARAGSQEAFKIISRALSGKKAGSPAQLQKIQEDQSKSLKKIADAQEAAIEAYKAQKKIEEYTKTLATDTKVANF